LDIGEEEDEEEGFASSSFSFFARFFDDNECEPTPT